jgi:hypothetical protein
LLEIFLPNGPRASHQASNPSAEARPSGLGSLAGNVEAQIIIAELGGERVLGFEIKAGASVTTGDARHLAWLRDELGDRFVAGAVFHTGPHAFPLGDRITALRSAPSGAPYPRDTMPVS